MKHNERAGGVVTLEQPVCPDCDGTRYVEVREVPDGWRGTISTHMQCTECLPAEERATLLERNVSAIRGDDDAQATPFFG